MNEPSQEAKRAAEWKPIDGCPAVLDYGEGTINLENPQCVKDVANAHNVIMAKLRDEIEHWKAKLAVETAKLREQNNALFNQLQKHIELSDYREGYGRNLEQETAKLREELKTTQRLLAEKDQTATVFMNQVKDLQRQRNKLREENTELWQRNRERGPQPSTTTPAKIKRH